jgi:hypothetical protein
MFMGPVFLLAGGGRTGSTLLQRLMLSTKEVLMWGEHGGVVVFHLRTILSRLKGWLSWEGAGTFQRQRFLKLGSLGYHSWLSNMNPDLSLFKAACKQFLEHTLAEPARELGYPRWGFKEILYGRDDALFLQEVFPDASFLLLVRNPIDCLKSIKGVEWFQKDWQGDSARFIQSWTRLSGDLVRVLPELKQACLLRYEDVCSQREDAVKTIAKTCQIAEDRFDRAVFSLLIRGTDKPPAPLDTGDETALSDPDFLKVAESLGYQVP